MSNFPTILQICKLEPRKNTVIIFSFYFIYKFIFFCYNIYIQSKKDDENMIEKEIAEIRRRYKPEKHNISRIRGCYVDAKKEILSEFTQSLELMTQDETESILALFRKTLGGTLGKNLVDIEFPNEVVLESEEHKTLMKLRETELKDDEEIHNLYKRIIDTVRMEEDYLILL